MEQKFGKNSIFYKTTMINLHACYCALFADIEQKSPFLFADIK